MSPYELRTANSCGPDACFQVVHGYIPTITQADVDRAWGIEDIKKFRDLGDTPWNHFSALEKLKIPFELISAGDILSGRGIPGQTVILIHNVGADPEVRSLFLDMARFIRANLEEDWIVLESVNPSGVRCFFGDGTVKQINTQKFMKMFHGGVVKCAYVVGRGNYKLSWYQRLWGKFTGRFY